MQSAIQRPIDRLMTEVEAANILGLSRRTMRAWRVRGGGPKYAKMGAAVRYTAADLEQFIKVI